MQSHRRFVIIGQSNICKRGGTSANRGPRPHRGSGADSLVRLGANHPENEVLWLDTLQKMISFS